MNLKFRLLLTALIVTVTSSVTGRDVLMRFWAQKDYVRPLGADGKPSAETYTYFIGDYYPGAYEKEADAIKFDTVAKILVAELGPQNYLMAENPKDADYILMVNWGQTTPEAEKEEVTYQSFDDEGEDYDIAIDEVSEANRRKNAKLLGANKMYDMSYISLKKQLLEEAIVQDRYFINIFAVSIHDIRNRDKENPKIKATWECQLSVPVNNDRSAEDAFRAMAKSGSEYFGKNVRDLTFMKEGIKKGVVTIGEIRFLGDEETDSESAETEQE
ncbi:MAG: hypothetical protein ACSHX8_09805 [Opitutaceae bacterium]